MQLSLEGTLSLGPGKQCGGEAGPLNGPVFPLILQGKNAAPKAEADMLEQQVDSPGAFETLPWPANLRATVTYFHAPSGAVFVLEFTYDDDTTTELAVAGMALIEHDSDNPVKALAVKGEGLIRWLATGQYA